MNCSIRPCLAVVGVAMISATIFGVGSHLSAQATDAEVIFFDGFESGDFGAWEGNEASWAIVKNATNAHDGSYRAQIVGNTHGEQSIRKTVSTAGYGSVELVYWRRVNKALESGDHFTVEWSTDGLASITVEDLNDMATTSWADERYSFPASADDRADLRLKFTGRMNASNDEVRLDDVLLTGVLLVTPTYEPTPTPVDTPMPTPTPTETEILSPEPELSDTPPPGRRRRVHDIDANAVLALVFSDGAVESHAPTPDVTPIHSLVSSPSPTPIPNPTISETTAPTPTYHPARRPVVTGHVTPVSSLTPLATPSHESATEQRANISSWFFGGFWRWLAGLF